VALCDRSRQAVHAVRVVPSAVEFDAPRYPPINNQYRKKSRPDNRYLYIEFAERAPRNENRDPSKLQEQESTRQEEQHKKNKKNKTRRTAEEEQHNNFAGPTKGEQRT
jgi:hypothetical protein